MRLLLALIFILPLNAQASFLFQYGLNYSSQQDASESGEFEESRTFHKVLIGAAINGKKNLYLGWNINSWSSSLKQGTGDEDTYSMLEMGPRFQWFMDQDYRWYLSLEWNPYAKGDRDKAAESKEVSGSSIGLGFGYRVRISRLVGIGASLNYHSLSLTEEKVGTTENNLSDQISNIMPMLEFSILTR